MQETSETARDHGPDGTVLIVDDEEHVHAALGLAIKKISDIAVISVFSIESAIEVLESHPVNVILLDKDIPYSYKNETAPRFKNGIEAIPHFLKVQPHVQVIMFTGSSTIADCLHAMKLGALTYIVKNTDNNLLRQHIVTGVRISRDKQRQIRLERLETAALSGDLSGNSLVMIELRNRLQLVAQTERPVLLLGESGTGKTTAAKFINAMRKRYLKQKERPFFALNIAAVANKLVERELFGNEKGAYTDADARRPGFFELANDGTVFLDEFGEASPQVQAKLLKVVEEGTFFRVGGTQELTSRFKLICATNRNLERLVAEGKFRSDLYYRVKMLSVIMPRLEERREDIPEIARSLLPKICKWVDLPEMPELPRDFIEYLVNLKEFPGNVRCLEERLLNYLLFTYKDSTSESSSASWDNFLKKSNEGNRTAVLKDAALSRDEIFSRPIDVIDENFPGLKPFLEGLTDRIYLEARRKFPRSKDVARVLKVPESAVSERLKRLRSANEKSTQTQEFSEGVSP